jgi:hypothetical protein
VSDPDWYAAGVTVPYWGSRSNNVSEAADTVMAAVLAKPEGNWVIQHHQLQKCEK